MLVHTKTPCQHNEMFTWWLPFLGLCAITYCIHINTYLWMDLAIISHTAAQMLQGQVYGREIFEPNPPLIFYLHIPPIIFAKLSGIQFVYCLRIYLLSLIFLCISGARYLFKILFDSNIPLTNAMSYALVYILLFLPMPAFGQREHFLIILTLPYLLMAACRLNNKPINPSIAILFGILAGVGFSIKPFFLPCFLLIEMWFVYQRNHIWGWVRIESVLALFFIVGYILAVIFFYPAYWQVVLPLWIPYYRGIIQSWEQLLLFFPTIFCLVALALAAFTQQKEENVAIKRIFAIAMLGFLITFFLPRVAWYYHVLPALSIAGLYFTLILAELAQKIAKSAKRLQLQEGLMLALIAILIFAKPIWVSLQLTTDAIAYFHGNNNLRQLSAYLDKYAPNSTYDFFSMTLRLYDLELYSTVRYVGTLSFSSWEYNRLPPLGYSSEFRQKTHNYVLNIINHDLNVKKPRFVIVDIPSSLTYLKQRIDFTEEYSKNSPQFRAAWTHYEYLNSIGPYDIYERKSPK